MTWRSLWMLYLLASRKARMRSSSIARLSQKTSAAAELDDCGAVGVGPGGAVHDLDRLAVLHRDQAGRTDEIGLTQPVQGHLRRIVLVAEHRLEHFDLVDTARADLAHCQTVADLHKDRGRENRGDHEIELVVALRAEGDERRLLQRQEVVAHPGTGVSLMRELVGVAVGLGPGDVVAMARVHLDPAGLRRPVEPESDEKFVQQTG